MNLSHTRTARSFIVVFICMAIIICVVSSSSISFIVVLRHHRRRYSGHHRRCFAKLRHQLGSFLLGGALLCGGCNLSTATDDKRVVCAAQQLHNSCLRCTWFTP